MKLSCKDAFSSQLFKDVEELLLRLYYLYAKSPKKSRELSDIVVDLQEVFEFPKGGNLPIRSQGLIINERHCNDPVTGMVLTSIISQHLLKIPTIKSDDQARLKGYLQKWRHAKMLIGAALYVDILKPASCLSLYLQDDHLDIVAGHSKIMQVTQIISRARSSAVAYREVSVY